MNILFCTTHFNTGGITSYVMTLGEALVKSGHRVWVASSGGDCVVRLESMGIKHVKVNIRTKSELSPKVFATYPVLKSLIKDEAIQVIHAHTRVTQVLGFYLGRSCKVKVVTTCHGFFRPRWFRKLFPCWGDAVIAISKPVAQHLIQDFGVDPKKVFQISNGIDLNRFVMTTPELRQRSRSNLAIGDRPLIGIIARLSDVKGIDVLIKSLPLILKEFPEAQLLIAGQGPQENYLRQLAKDMGLSEFIIFKETVGHTQELLSAFDVFVMPSLMEGLGLSVIEAQACGIPVVASKVGGLIDLIEDGKSGYLVSARDPHLLAEAILKVLKSPSEARSMALKARAQVEQNFSVQNMLPQVLKIYE